METPPLGRKFFVTLGKLRRFRRAKKLEKLSYLILLPKIIGSSNNHWVGGGRTLQGTAYKIGKCSWDVAFVNC